MLLSGNTWYSCVSTRTITALATSVIGHAWTPGIACHRDIHNFSSILIGVKENKYWLDVSS